MNLNVYEYAWASLIRPVRHSASETSLLRSLSAFSLALSPFLPLSTPLSLLLALSNSMHITHTPRAPRSLHFPSLYLYRTALSLLFPTSYPSLSFGLFLPLSSFPNPLPFPPLLPFRLLFIFVSFAVVGNSKSSVSAAVLLPQQMATAALDQARWPFPFLTPLPPSPISPFHKFLWPTKTIKSSELLMRQSKQNICPRLSYPKLHTLYCSCA